jgi:hypothetical protein
MGDLRVIELHVLGMQVQLLSTTRWSRRIFVTFCGLSNLIKQHELLPLLSEALQRPERTT